MTSVFIVRIFFSLQILMSYYRLHRDGNLVQRTDFRQLLLPPLLLSSQLLLPGFHFYGAAVAPLEAGVHHVHVEDLGAKSLVVTGSKKQGKRSAEYTTKQTHTFNATDIDALKISGAFVSLLSNLSRHWNSDQ